MNPALDQLPAIAQLVSQLRAHPRRLRRVEAFTDLIGDTPLVRLSSLEKDTPGVELWAKCEFANPGGSVKDRAAYRMIADAMERGDLRPGMNLIDSTSGNTGIAYSMIGASLGLKVSLVMPSNVSMPRKQVTTAYGTEIIYSDPMYGSDGAIVMVRELVAADPDRYYYPDQYSNPSNWRAHYLGTGPEIWAQTRGRVTHFVTGIGTSGTIMGTSRALHELSADRSPELGGRVHCIGMQPDDAFHGLEGLKYLESSIIPGIYDGSVLDETMFVGTEDGWDMSERLSDGEGLLVGHSSGGNVAAAYRVAKRLSEAGESGVVVTVLCDRGDRYFAPLEWERHYTW